MKHLNINIDKFEIAWEEILKNINFVLNEKDKIAIVWWNWVWKSTLLKILYWEIKTFDWKIDNVWNLKIWYLNQIFSENENKTVREELKDAFTEINLMEDELKNIEKEMSENPENMDLIENYTSLLEQFNNIWGYNYNNKIHQVASWIWIFNLLEKNLNEVSWGQRTKIALAKILLESPDILMLDEPTNFIDLKSVEWLENYLKTKWTWGYVIISHDREFLDKTCWKTFEMQELRPITFYHTNYSNYILEREKVENKSLERWERQQEFIEKEEALINRFRAGSRAWFAKSREKALDRLEKIDKPYIPSKPFFFLNYLEETNEKIFTLKECFIGRKEPLFYINEVNLNKKNRVWIIWENWTWKSTLLKTLLWQIDILDWNIYKWKWLKIAYYSQMHEELDKNLSIRDNFEKHWIIMPEQQLISILKYYLFDKEDINRKVWELSWGQISKVLFAILGQKETNILILDEPTNHLDYDAREALEKAINKYKWTILFISHDRYFTNKIASHLWVIENQELSVCYWNYEDFKYKKEHWIDFDASLFDEEAQLNLTLEEKIWEKEARRIKQKFWRWNKRK